MSSKKDIDITHRCLSDIPFVKRAVKRVLALEREKKILVDENKMLKRMVDVLLDKNNTTCRCHCNNYMCSSTKFNDVKIKTEQNKHSDASTTTEFDNHENVVYKISHVDDSVEIVVNDKKKEIITVIDETNAEKDDEDNAKEYESKNLMEEFEQEEEEEEEEEETEEVEVEEEEEETEEVEVEEEEEEEVYEVIINNKSYYTTNEIKGYIYAIEADEEIGDKIGEFKDGKPVFFKTKK